MCNSLDAWFSARQKLDKKFGPGRWRLIPGTQLSHHPSGAYFQRWLLYVQDRYVTAATAQRDPADFFSIDGVYEAILGDCTSMIAKELGLCLDS